MKKKKLYPQTKIKKIGVEYLNQCTKLDENTLNGIWTKEQWYKELTSSKRISIGAILDSELIGLTSAWLTTDEINITFVGVLPFHQKQGVGTLMILSLLGFSRKIGISIATLEVKEKNIAGKLFYESLDFHQIGLRKKLYKDGSNAVIYRHMNNFHH